MPATKSWLDHAMMKYGGTYLDTDVEEVKTIGRIMIIFAIFIPYWTIYFQVITSYIIFKNVLNCCCSRAVLKINHWKVMHINWPQKLFFHVLALPTEKMIPSSFESNSSHYH